MTQQLGWWVYARRSHIRQTPHDNYKRSPLQEGSARVKPWKINEYLGYWEYTDTGIGQVSKYFTIFLTSVRSVPNQNKPNHTYCNLFLGNFIPLSVSQWNDLADPVFDGG